MDKGVWTYRESDHEDGTSGREIALSDVAFSPLGYAELNDAILHQPMPIPLVGHGKIVSSSIDGTEVGQCGQFRMTLESPYTSKSIGLVRGGWLPSAIALRDNSIVLPDRCVVAQLSARLKNGITKPQAKDFIDLFADSAVRINPVLFVLEGDDRENPNQETLERHLREAVSKIQSALPKAILVAADAQALKGVLGLIEETQSSMAHKQDFLEHLNPKLKSPVSRRKVRACWDEVLIAAKDCGIPSRSLVVLAALSAVVVPNGRSPAKKLLKFREVYTRADAYNALVDLRSLEVSMYSFVVFPDQPIMLCTADKNMALFWVGLRASNFAFDHGRMICDLAPDDLLPGIWNKKWKAVFDS